LEHFGGFCGHTIKAWQVCVYHQCCVWWWYIRESKDLCYLYPPDRTHMFNNSTYTSHLDVTWFL